MTISSIKLVRNSLLWHSQNPHTKENQKLPKTIFLVYIYLIYIYTPIKYIHMLYSDHTIQNCQSGWRQYILPKC